MATIAFLAQNAGIGLTFGSFGPLIGTVESKLHVTRDLSALGIPLAILGMSVLAPAAALIGERVSLRFGMMLGAVLSGLGYLLLAASGSIALDLLAYGILIGPGLALIGTVLPSTLAVRWFPAGAGRVLGLVNMPVLVMLTPFLVVGLIGRFGLSATYLAIAGLSFALILPLAFVVERPPGAATEPMTTLVRGMGAGAFLRRPDYWGIVFPAGAISAGGAMLVTHIAPMAMNWGLDSGRAASLVAVMGGAGIAGSFAFGALADRIGGSWSLAVNCLGQAFLLALLLTHPAYPLLLVLVAVIGVHTGAVTALFGVALSQRFGAASFSRGMALGGVLNLPLTVGAAPIAAIIFVRTGSYGGDLVLQMAVFAFAALSAGMVGMRGARPRLQALAG